VAGGGFEGGAAEFGYHAGDGGGFGGEGAETVGGEVGGELVDGADDWAGCAAEGGEGDDPVLFCGGGDAAHEGVAAFALGGFEDFLDGFGAAELGEFGGGFGGGLGGAAFGEGFDEFGGDAGGGPGLSGEGECGEDEG
jgi:hypothetical protein